MFLKLEPPSMTSMLSNVTNVPRPFADINSSYLHQQSGNPYKSMNFPNQCMGGPINNNLSHHGYSPKPPMFDPNSFINAFPQNIRSSLFDKFLLSLLSVTQSMHFKKFAR